MTVVFENPANGYRVKVDSVLAWLWTSIFGPFFFLFRGSTLHFFVWWLVAFTAIGPFVYPFFAASILRRMYYERGYRAIEQRPTSFATVAAVAAVFIVPVLFFVVLLSVGGRSSDQSHASVAVPQPSPARVAAIAATPTSVEETATAESTAYAPKAPRPNDQPARLTAEQIQTWEIPRLQFAIDSIYARYGTEFPRPDAQAWADRQPWYERVSGRTPEAAEQLMTADDRYNIQILAARRDTLRSKFTSETLYYIQGTDLNVHAGPGATYPVVTKLPGGFEGIRIVGESVYNGPTEWVRIAFADQSGWVARRFLAEQ